jgi:hypothetical protein
MSVETLLPAITAISNNYLDETVIQSTSMTFAAMVTM